MTVLNILFAFFAREKIRFMLGAGFTSIVMALPGLFVFIKVFQPTFEFWGIPYKILYVILPLIYIGANWLIGYLYERTGTWRHEWEHQITKQNPEYFELLADSKTILKKIEEMEKRV